jgi:uncharacterized membrane protein YfcA
VPVLWAILTGVGIGLMSGLVGIGGGVLLVPVFMYYYKMNIYHAIGTCLAVIAPVTLVGAISHHLKGNVMLAPVLWVAFGAMMGVFLGGQIAPHIPMPILRKAFAVFLIVVAVRIF